MQNWVKKIFYKFSFKKWEIYILKKEVIKILIQKPRFKLQEIKDYILLKVEVDDRETIIAADPFFHNEQNILFESISKKTGNGQIYKYDLLQNKKFRISLPINKHFSFPRTIYIRNNFFLTCESVDSKGLCIFQTNKELSLIKKAKLSDKSEDLNYHILDPILFEFEEKLLLYCTTTEYGNNSLLVFHSRINNLFNFKLKEIIKFDHKKDNSTTLRLAGMIYLKNKFNICTQNKETSYGSSLNILDIDFKFNQKLDLLYKSNIKSKLSCINMIGPHTINSSEECSMIAIDLATPSWKNFPLKIKHLCLKLFHA